MNKPIHVDFTIDGINEAITKLEKFRSLYNSLGDRLVEEIAKDGLNKLNELYASTPYQNNVNPISTRIEKIQGGYKIVAEGNDVLYEEFGTGDYGADDGHPEKMYYNMNPYNSGETIRSIDVLYNSINRDKMSTDPSVVQHAHDKEAKVAQAGLKSKYWTYKKDGEIHYTSGIPAGKQMYDTRNYIINIGAKKIQAKLVGDVLSKL